MGAAEAAAYGAVAVTPAPHPTGGLLRGQAEPPQNQGGQNQQGGHDGRRGGDGGHGSGLASSASCADQRRASHSSETYKTGGCYGSGSLAAFIFGDAGDREQREETDSKGRSEQCNAGDGVTTLTACDSAANVGRRAGVKV